jgi:HD-GYP domain-containing protein (c-di-GMP phosphodiesterase class II)
MDNYTYEHSVNVIVLSLIMGLELNYSKDRLYSLAVGAMLHDVGKVFVPKDILLKDGKLTEMEFDIIKEHPSRGYDYLKEEIGVSAMSRIIILQHHERVDGTGYPEGMCGSRIHEFSKIVSIADVYDALTSDRPYRRGLPPNDAIEYIMGSADRYFDFDMVNAFLKRIVPYPAGTMVRLSNGDIAVVKEINRDYPLRPKVTIVWSDGESVCEEPIDLMDINNLVIKGVEHNIPDGDLYRSENAI